MKSIIEGIAMRSLKLSSIALVLLVSPLVAADHQQEELAKSYRAVVVPLTSVQAKVLKPGDYVDVIVAFDQPLVGEKEGISKAKVTIPVAATIVQNVKVIQLVSSTSDSNVGVELAANPSEAQWVIWAVAWGKGVYLSRRASGDHEIHPIEEANVNKFLR